MDRQPAPLPENPIPQSRGSRASGMPPPSSRVSKSRGDSNDLRRSTESWQSLSNRQRELSPHPGTSAAPVEAVEENAQHLSSYPPVADRKRSDVSADSLGSAALPSRSSTPCGNIRPIHAVERDISPAASVVLSEPEQATHMILKEHVFSPLIGRQHERDAGDDEPPAKVPAPRYRSVSTTTLVLVGCSPARSDSTGSDVLTPAGSSFSTSPTDMELSRDSGE